MQQCIRCHRTLSSQDIAHGTCRGCGNILSARERTSGRSNRLFIIIEAIVIVLLSAIVIGVIGQYRPLLHVLNIAATGTTLTPPSTSQPTVPAPADSKLETVRFSNGNNYADFGLNFPPDWSITNRDSGNSNQKCFIYKVTSKFCIASIPPSFTPENYTSAVKERITNSVDGAANITVPSTPISKTIGANTWATFIVSFNINAMNYTAAAFLLPNPVQQPAHFFAVVYYAPITDFSSSQSQYFEPMLSSFTILSK